ncbi:MAG: ATP-binding cassette domain-containing protein [Actinobacteria bacterium]|nr:ATP-binding cassette domain-containing protein [Actinomycetota bacterium]
MSDFLPFIVLGIATGSLYGLAGSGLVLTYKTSGLFNFGYGAIAAAAAYIFYFLHQKQHVGWLLSLLLAVIVLGVVVGFLFERLASALSDISSTLKIVATVGVVLIVQGVTTIAAGPDTITLERFLPDAAKTFQVAGATITYEQVAVTGVAMAAVGLFYALFRWARIGIAMRAAVDNPDLLAMQATDPARVRRTAWVIGSIFAALSGVLIAPMTGLNSILLTYLVVQAFGAAAIGAFSSIPLTFLGGILIGIGSAISTRYVVQVPWLAGLPSSLPFLVLFVALLVVPKRKLVPLTRVRLRAPPQYRAPTPVRVAVGVVLLAGLIAVPQVVGARLPYFTEAVITGMMLLSLGLLVRTSNQVSLCHAAFAAVGAVAFSQLHVDAGVPWILAMLGAGAVTMAIGALVAIPAIRLSGLFLALSTLGFGILVERLFYNQSFMFTTFSSGRKMPLPGFAADPKSFFYVTLAALVLTGLLVVLLQRSRLGRMLRALGGSPTAVTAMGLNINVTKVVVFCISAFLAGIAGALLGVDRGYAVSSDPFFLSFNSLVLLAMLAIAPFAEPWYAIVALAGVLPGYISGNNTTVWLNVMFGAAAVVVATQGGPAPMPLRLQQLLDRLGRRRPAVEPEGEDEVVRGRPAEPGAPGLSTESLVVRFGGLVAVDGLALEAPLGRITGLIGPNGAGKTTTFDVCSGFNRSFDGRVRLHGADVTRMSPSARARDGLGRTFQRVELGGGLTVLENVMLGAEASEVGAHVLPYLTAGRGDKRHAAAAAWAALEECGIVDLAHQQAGSLSTGQARLVELARLLAGPFDMLLLDEPSSGLDEEETNRFAKLLEGTVAERKVGVLLVEHDVELVSRVCDYIYVLDFGELIFAGTPAEMMSSEVVRAAYLGDDAVMSAVAAAPSPEQS